MTNRVNALPRLRTPAQPSPIARAAGSVLAKGEKGGRT